MVDNCKTCLYEHVNCPMKHNFVEGCEFYKYAHLKMFLRKSGISK